MAKKSKLETPEWIKQRFESKEAYEKKKEIKNKTEKQGKTFKVKKCPKCGSHDVNVVLIGEEEKNNGEWECKKCKWHGREIDEEELQEGEFMKYLDEKGEEVA